MTSKESNLLTEYQTLIRRQRIREGQKAIAKAIEILGSSGKYPDLIDEAISSQAPLPPTEANAKKVLTTLTKVSEAVNEFKKK